MEYTAKVEVIKVSQDFDGLSIQVKTDAILNGKDVRESVAKLTTGYIVPRVGTLEHNILWAKHKYDLTHVTNWEEVKIEYIDYA